MSHRTLWRLTGDRELLPPLDSVYLPHDEMMSCSCSVGREKMLVMELLLCNKLFCSSAGVGWERCGGAFRTRVMSQSARRATRPASNAEVPACGTARCVPRCGSSLMTDAACPAVEMNCATVTNWSPGSAVTARSHEVKADAATSHRSRMRRC